MHKKDDDFLILNYYVIDTISKEGIDQVRGGNYLDTTINESQLFSLINADICIKHKIGIEYCGCTFSKNIIDGSPIFDPSIYDFCSCCNEPFYSDNSLRNHERTCY
jgi:hypothetical protein